MKPGKSGKFPVSKPEVYSLLTELLLRLLELAAYSKKLLFNSKATKALDISAGLGHNKNKRMS